MSTEMEQANEMVTRESEQFRSKIPELLPKYQGRYVVFKNGVVHSDHESLSEAFASGVQTFGLYGGQVIDRVVTPRPLQISPAILRGWSK